MDHSQLESFRKLIAHMSDRELSAFLSKLSLPSATTPLEEVRQEIPEDILQQYQDLRALLTDPIHSSAVDAEQRRWLRAIRLLNTLRVRRPLFYNNCSDEALYRRLKLICAKKLLPESMIERILPSLMAFIRTGQMERPILFWGAKGCGKTTAAKIVIEAALGLPAFVCSASDSYGRGLAGKSVTWRGATYGTIFDACVRSNSLNPGLIIDEIDKVQRNANEAPADDILLSVCDDRREVDENFLGMPISTRHMPIFFTGNDPEHISEPLLDRCMIYEFPDATPEQIFSICKEYCAQLMQKNNYIERVVLDSSILYEGIRLLYPYEHSIRQHKNMIENVLGLANIHSLENKCKVEVPLKAFEAIISKNEGRLYRKIGFGRAPGEPNAKPPASTR